MTKKEMLFLGNRMKQLREKNGVNSIQAMVNYLQESNPEKYGDGEYGGLNKSTLSRVESASVSEKTVVKWARAYCESLQAGFRAGTSKLANRVCYGYQKNENGELIVCHEQAEVVCLIFDLYLGGNSLSGISKELRSRGIPSPTGKEKWTSCAIDKILSNEKYIGDVMLQKTFRKNVFTDKQTRNQGEKARYVYENKRCLC